MALLAAFSVLLARYSRQTDILIGSPIANRGRVEFEKLIGFFANTIVLRNDLSGNPSFRTLLRRVSQQTLDAYEHQDLPFERIVQELNVERLPNINPLFQVMFVLQNTLTSKQKLAQLEMDWLDEESGTAKFDLVLEMSEEDSSGGMRGKFEYSVDLFDAATIARMIGHFQLLLAAIVANPDQDVTTLSFITAQEQAQLLCSWNATETNYPRKQCIQDLFEEQVVCSPDAIALVFDEAQVTYGELNWRADVVAQLLRQLCVGPEVLVGICMERSIEQIIGILATLKAGGAYVPIDPAYPQERIQYLFADSGIAVLLTQSKLREHSPVQSLQVITLDEVNYAEGNPFPSMLDTHAVATNLAYVMYTSGSTGKPKGVSVVHRSVVRLVKETNYARFTDQETFLQFAPIAFDASTLELWGSLLHGARLVIAPPYNMSLGELGSLIRRQGITTAWFTAGLFHQLVEFQLESLLTLRQLLAGGDVLSITAVRQFLTANSTCSLINGYGPTENTTFTCCYPMSDVTQIASTVPIGFPIANTQVYVLDEQLQLVPIGIPGELYIGGDGLSRGYYQRPDLSAERFVPHPFSACPGERLYKTGDIVRYRENGVLEFIQRSDFQVKLRGFRIELGEIEAVLHEHPAIRAAFVMVRERTPDDKYLAAYIVAELELETRQLQMWLQEKLPSYMVPAVIVTIDQLPLSPNGKVDRNVLSQIDHDRALSLDQASRVEHQYTDAEEILLGIWQEVLGIKQIDINANFFALGGYSLLATRVIARVSQSLLVTLPLRSLFENPTVASLARLVEQYSREGSHTLPPLVAASSRPEHLPLSLAQQRLWFLCQLDPENPFYHIPVAFQVHGPLHVAALEQSLQILVQRHEILRTRFPLFDGQPFQMLDPEPTIALTVSTVSAELVSEQVQAAFRRPFDLAQGPLWRVYLWPRSEQEYLLLFTFHHLIFDGWSQEVFVQELGALYTQVTSQQQLVAPALPALEVQYAEYTLWQRQWLTDEVLAPQVRYWRQRLSGANLLLSLPSDAPRPAVQTFRGATLEQTLPTELWQQLVQVSQREGVTLFMTLLAAYAVLLARSSGQHDLLIGTPTANRPLLELEGMIGFFVNTLVIRVEVGAGLVGRTLLQRVRESVLSASAHQDVPFEKLVEEIQPERSLSYNPLFQVAFALWRGGQETVLVGETCWSTVTVESESAKQDLMLNMQETEQGLVAHWEYAVDLFAADTIREMMARYALILQELVSGMERPVWQWMVLTAEEQERMLSHWNTTPSEGGSSVQVQQMISAQAAQQPDAVAVVEGERQWSYGELDRCSEVVAQALRQRGVRPEVRVGVCLPRSWEQVVTLVGVLKAGGVYVPLDLRYPQERLQLMHRDAHLALVVVHAETERRWVQQEQVVRWEALWGPAPESETVAAIQGDGANLAYIIYTSGSTGVPKGVMVSHAGLWNLAQAQMQQFGTQRGKRVLQAASLSFDASIWELALALVSGGTLVLAAQDVIVSGDRLQHVLAEQAVATITLTPTVLASVPAGGLPALETVIAAGEACRGEEVARWSVGRHFYNAYGPTETTVCASVGLCEPGEERPGIGKPLTNMQMYLLDEDGQLVPRGVEGEIYVGGAGLARGYVGRADRTAERFVPHPYSEVGGARLYRTGDRGMYRRDGSMLYVGRRDQQVKLRGFRIELGEIEETLRGREEIQDVAVILREDVGRERQIVAYIVSAVGVEVQSSDIRTFLKKHLPQYMVPAFIVQLPVLPLTANAKLDKQALPIPGELVLYSGEELVEPDSQLERLIAGVWKEVLHIERIGIHDNFFDLGGHSLLLTSLQQHLCDKLGRPISLVELLRYTTVSAQALHFEQETSQKLSQQAPQRTVARSTTITIKEQQESRQSRQNLRRSTRRSSDNDDEEI